MDFKEKPLAYKMRPSSLEEFVGQEHLIGNGKPLRIAIEKKVLPSSIIFWGPPGCGKTTLAKLLSRLTESEFVELSAVSAGKDDIRRAIDKTRLLHRKIVLFLDEIHRFNKAQQDFLLPYVENGTITLIGATTENPSFEVISALLSRSRVFVLNRLKEEDIKKIISNAMKSEKGLKSKAMLKEECYDLIAQLSNGDARSALNILEIASTLTEEEITKEIVINAAQKKFLTYDKDGEEHYNIISALHKSMRDSDAQAAVYWTMRMIEAGEDPKYIIRRMIRFASEDVGNADPLALKVAVAAKDAVEFLGYPECDTALVQTAVYLAKAPKSNAIYKAVQKSREDIEKTGNLPVPLHLRNAPTKLMKQLNYGKGYKYTHDYKDAKVEQKHLPDELEGSVYYEEKS
ncbi:replication-associated recombination protein A [Candidatus Pacearchaeota archaeon]|nr:replication-associated recombination protein A [Candidatus Pacearchaeota archaeon]